jgi:hypothetical protein
MSLRIRLLLTLLCATSTVQVAAASDSPPAPPPAAAADGPNYDADGKLLWPANYREWIFLSSGIDMNYNPLFNMPGHSMFTNAFVNPSAYHAFVASGHWPDKTVLLIEARGASGKGSINKAGKYQDSNFMGLEAHVRDTSRFEGGWGFFAFSSDKPAALIPQAADCYSCHAKHGAVDTTFVQFYPTLIDLATQKGTLSEAYRQDQATTR